VVAANDEFFAPKEGLVKASAPEWREGVYTERGKWMDGWETRRRREPGHDWAIIRLGARGIVRGVVIDTAFYTGNYPDRASIDGAFFTGVPSVAELTGSASRWHKLLGERSLSGNTQNAFAINDSAEVTHLRLNIFPDGGVARLRVHGSVSVSDRVKSGELADLAALENGGFVVLCSDMHYGDRQNLILPGRSTHMGNGWETRRRRSPGNEWTVVQLATRGAISRVEVDTDHYRGNAPGWCSIETCDLHAGDRDISDPAIEWTEIVARTPLQPDARHSFDIRHAADVSHVRLSIYPDGGVARLRVFGKSIAS
jgi:allantoicase